MKYARLELERRWLVPSPPPEWSPDTPHRVLEDRYLEGTRRTAEPARREGLALARESVKATQQGQR
ncbi:hypothetical protein DYH09_33335 [bacterium CPR1]|nr:hypothetical protein [bacterium CPR1]